MYSRKRTYSNRGSGKSAFTSKKSTHARMDYQSAKLYPSLLMNPFKLNQDVRIPDGQALVPTCTFDVNHEFDISLNSAGFGGFCIGLTSKPQLWTLGAGTTATSFIWDKSRCGITLDNAIPASGSGTEIWQSGQSFGVTTQNHLVPSEEFWDSVDRAYRGFRLVAGGVKVEFVGNDTNNQGVLQMCQINGGVLTQTSAKNDGNFDYTDYSEQAAGTASYTDFLEGNTYVSQISDWRGGQLVSPASTSITTTGTNVPIVTQGNNSVKILCGTAGAPAGSYLTAVIPSIPDHNTIDKIRNTHGALVKPAKDGAQFVYSPTGPSDFQYRRPNVKSQTRTAPDGNTGDWLVWNPQAGQGETLNAITGEYCIGPFAKTKQVGDTGNGAILCVISGGPTGSVTTHKARIVLHYEALPESNVNLSDNGKIAYPMQASVNEANAVLKNFGGGK